MVQPLEEQSEEVERLQVLRLSWVVKTVHRMRGPCRKRRGEDAAIEAGDAQGGAPPHVAHCTEERRYRTASGEGWGWTVSSRAKRG